MQKKILTLAVAGALAAPAAAFAQAQIYGRANLGVDTYEATGARTAANDLKKRARVFDFGSRVGFRGTEDLGGGVSAVFQIENGVSMDTGSTLGQGGQANASGGTWASRDSWVGLQGGAGRLTFGRQSIFWANGAINDFGANQVNSELPWTTGAGLGRVAVGVSRQNNVAQYTTPTMGGFNATLSRAFNSETATGTVDVSASTTANLTTGAVTTVSATNANTDAMITGLTARFNQGPLSVQFDWAKNEGATPTPTTGTRVVNNATKIGIAYRYAPGARVSFINTNTDVTGTAVTGFRAAADKVKASARTFNWEHTFGNIMPMVAVGSVGDAKGCSVVTAGVNGCDNTGSTGQLVAVKYTMSKRTWVYLSYLAVKNKDNAVADYGGGAYTSVNGTLPAGADPKVMAAGLMHNF